MTQESLQLRGEIKIDEARAARTLAHMEMIAKKRERDAEFQTLPPDEIEPEVLNHRIEEMRWDYEKVASIIPVQLSFHLEDGEDKWDITSGTKPENNSNYIKLRCVDAYGGVEEFYFETGEKPIAIHSDSHRSELRQTFNSEREIRAGEVLFRRIWKPLLDHHDAPYASDKLTYDS